MNYTPEQISHMRNCVELRDLDVIIKGRPMTDIEIIECYEQHFMLPIGAIVTVIKVIDEEGDANLIGQTGEVIDRNFNNATGNTLIDPLYVVRFDDRTESFWFEELKQN
jgi:hypothetical protein